MWWEEEKRDKKETGETASAVAKRPIHSSTATRKKRVDWFKGQNARTKEAKEGEGGGGITKMLRGPYSHSHGAQRAVIKLHYQTG